MAIAVVLVVMITLTITVHVYGYWHCMRYQTSGNLLPSCWTVAGAVLTQSVPLPGMPLFRTKGLRVREATQLVGLQALWSLTALGLGAMQSSNGINLSAPCAKQRKPHQSR